MPDSSLSNKGISKNFKIMLVILFFMEFARGMYVLSYVNYLPTVTSIAVAVTSADYQFTLYPMRNEFCHRISFEKFGTKLVLTLGFY